MALWIRIGFSSEFFSVEVFYFCTDVFFKLILYLHVTGAEPPVGQPTT